MSCLLASRRRLLGHKQTGSGYEQSLVCVRVAEVACQQMTVIDARVERSDLPRQENVSFALNLLLQIDV